MMSTDEYKRLMEASSRARAQRIETRKLKRADADAKMLWSALIVRGKPANWSKYVQFITPIATPACQCAACKGD